MPAVLNSQKRLFKNAVQCIGFFTVLFHYGLKQISLLNREQHLCDI